MTTARDPLTARPARDRLFALMAAKPVKRERALDAYRDELLAEAPAETTPAGPALIYVTSAGEKVPVDTEPIADARERDLFRALTARAGRLADKADTDDNPAPEPRTGNYL